jgi:hypothetical protein
MSYEIKSEDADYEYNSDNHELIKLLTNCSSNICQDSMGRSSIVYFPNVVLTHAEHISVFEEFENGH